MLRGGIHSLTGSADLLQLLPCFVLYVVKKTVRLEEAQRLTATQRCSFRRHPIARTDLTMTISLLEELNFVLEHYGCMTFAFQMCPIPLFTEIIKINLLHVRASKQEPTGAENLTWEAYGILSRIHSFSPARWAEPKPSSKEDRILLGNVYQAAVALYYIPSLQSLSVLPLNPLLRASCTAHGQLLQVLLNQALSSPRNKGCILWPLVVLGMETVNGNVVMRTFAQEPLPEISRYMGTHVPLTLKGVLERFWASGETHWDACLDIPYSFITQIAVDSSNCTS
ncbi:hypothetical protein BBP40_010507 [Aspergillus hancockii]|nr:hypothetical protein BBP40_010507 [Aspergillus hancockii]